MLTYICRNIDYRKLKFVIENIFCLHSGGNPKPFAPFFMELMGRRFGEKRKIVKEKLNIVSTSVIDGKVGHGAYMMSFPT